ncbi:MAG: methyltransferase domain-containing protein [Deltaproteobacteria bacterium]|nr:methyltransferase domain-containing protein [Deltaproteobacteria bacterium]
MNERSVDPPNGPDSEAPSADGERRLRKSRRGLRIPTGTHGALSSAPPQSELDLPDLEHEPLLSDTPVLLDTGSDVEITASDEVEVSVSETESAMITMPPPPVAPVAPIAAESSMRVVRRRIRKVGSDAPPSSYDGFDVPRDAMVPSPARSPSTPPPPAPSESAPAVRPSRPPPPRAPARPAMISANAASIFTAPTIPPIPDPMPPPSIAVPRAPAVPQALVAAAPPHDDAFEFTIDPDDEMPTIRSSDPSLALLDDLADLPIGQEAHAPRVSPSRIPPPPPEPPSRSVRPPAPPPPPVAARPLAVTMPDQSRRRRRHWWEELFNDDYLRTVTPLNPTQIVAEADWIEHALGVEGGAAVLDVGCGVGRHAIALAQRGYDVTGVDLSPTMVQRAQTNCLGAPRQPSFSVVDMLALDYEESFDAAFCVGSSFGFFDDQRNADVATRIHRALKDNGTFLLQVINRDHAIQSQPAMAWFEGDGCVCMEESSVNYITSRLNVKRTVIFDDGRQREIEYSVRLYSLHELGQLLHQSGFRILEVSGHVRTPGAFFGPSSRELIILAQKRGAEVIDLHDQGDHRSED